MNQQWKKYLLVARKHFYFKHITSTYQPKHRHVPYEDGRRSNQFSDFVKVDRLFSKLITRGDPLVSLAHVVQKCGTRWPWFSFQNHKCLCRGPFPISSKFCPYLISHSLFKLFLPPSSTSPALVVDSKGAHQSKLRASVMSSRRSSRSSTSNVTEEKINDLVSKLQSLLPQRNQRRNETV